MRINRDTLGHLENPNLILMKASGERVGVLPCTHKVWAKKYNDMDELSFEIPYMTDGRKTSFYDQIDVMKYIEANSIGAAFAIKDVTIENEGQKTEYKKVECLSRECELGQKYIQDFVINCGTTGSIDQVSFYQPGNQPHSLLHLLFEKLPNWSFGHISSSLWSMKRSFDESRTDVYSFLMDDVANAFECIFTFDSLNCVVNAYTVDEYGQDSNVHVSYNNLLENTEMEYSIDEIKTAVILKGDDDLDVREINMGLDTIYDFSAYASEEYFSSSLLTAYNAWVNLVNTTVDLNLFTYKSGVITRTELQGKTYRQAFTLLLTKYQDLYTQISKWSSTLLPYGINTRKNPGYGTISYTEDGSDKVIFEKQTSVQLVNSLPSSGSATVLYLVKNTNNMYRWNGAWVNVNLWNNCALAELKTLQAGAENLQSVAMKAGYGNPDDLNTNNQKRYVDTYLPALYMYNALTKQIETVNSTISTLESNQNIIQTDKMVIVNKTAMKNNFSTAQLKELSSFIREDEITSSNFVVTDGMTEQERFDMLYALLDYGQKELSKVAVPQIQFSASLVNLFAIPEFDNYSSDFDVGNYVWVTLRDDYSIKAKILEVEIDFLDQSNFSVTFGNVVRKARDIFTDITNALNAATSAATSVSFGASYWSAAAEDTDNIGKALADGLLSQKYYLANAEDNETRIDENGVWITTTTGSHGRQTTDNYDSIYLGGGRILYTEDGWRTVSMSVGRGDVSMPSINSSGELVYTTESKFGVFADFLIAGYIGGSLLVGGDIYSSNYKTSSNKNSGNRGTHINLTTGDFEFNSKTTGKKRLFLKDNTLEVNGIIQAQKGHIGCDDNGDGGFIIDSLKIYNGKENFNSSAAGVYIGTNGIALGQTKTGNASTFSVDSAGYLQSISGKIGGWNIADTRLSSGNIKIDAGNNELNVNGVFVVYNDGSFKAANSYFSVDKNGVIKSTSGQIGGFTITSSYLANGKTSLYDTNAGVYLGTNGISLGPSNNFYVTSDGYLFSKYGNIGGAVIQSNAIRSDNGNWYIYSDGTASFKHITISDWAQINGVQWGSSFGSLNYNNGITWGSFRGSSTYGSNVVAPFTGNCVTHIKSLAVDEIIAKKATIGWASIDELNAESARIRELVATKASIEELNAVNANLTNLIATKASIDELNAVNANLTNLVATKASIDELNGVNATLTGRISAAEGDINTIKANYVSASTVDSKISSAIANFSSAAYFDQVTVGGTTVSGGVTFNVFGSDGTYYGQARCLGYMLS